MTSFFNLMSGGLSALLLLTRLEAVELADAIPQEIGVDLKNFQNGVKSYVHQKTSPRGKAYIQVAVKKDPIEQEIYHLNMDGQYIEEAEKFFIECQKNILSKNASQKKPQAVGVIAVGDLVQEKIESMIETYFSSLKVVSPTSLSLASRPHVEFKQPQNGQPSRLTLHFLSDFPPLKTMEDLHSHWKKALSQFILKKRLEKAVQELSLQPVKDEDLLISPQGNVPGIVVDCEDAQVVDVLGMLLKAVEKLQRKEVTQEEFLSAKTKYQDMFEISHEASSEDHETLASYYCYQFFHNNEAPAFEHFIEVSSSLVEQISLNDVALEMKALLNPESRYIEALCLKDSAKKLKKEYPSFFAASHPDFLKHQTAAVAPQGDDLDDLLDDIQAEPDRDVYVDNNIGDSGGDFTSNDPYERLPIFDWEKKIIAKIVTTMANNNIIKLGLKKNSLEKKGDKINHVHPMRFLGYVFSDPYLKRCMNMIRKSSFKWDGFVDGLSRRMKEEAGKNNLVPCVPGFSKEVNADPDQVLMYINKKDYEGLVRFLIN